MSVTRANRENILYVCLSAQAGLGWTKVVTCLEKCVKTTNSFCSMKSTNYEEAKNFHTMPKSQLK